MSSHTADWNKLNDCYYRYIGLDCVTRDVPLESVLSGRRRELYHMQWGTMDLNTFVVAGAPFGGPVGNPRKPFKRAIVLNNAIIQPW